MIDKGYFLRQLETYLDNNKEEIMSLRKVKLRYTMKKLGEDRYQVIDTETNEPLWNTQSTYGESIWYCVMTAQEAENLIEQQLEEV